MEAGYVVPGVGRLIHVRIHFANQVEFSKLTGLFEIVLITGTLSVDGSHVHLSVSDGLDKMLGDHIESE